MSILDGLKIGAGLVAGAVIASAIVSIIALYSWIPDAEEEARVAERAAMQAATDKAIGELSNEADKARFERRLCRERGGVYLNSTGQCIQGSTVPHG